LPGIEAGVATDPQAVSWWSVARRRFGPSFSRWPWSIP